ncbi:Polyadenylate-binding protein [Musa troglodytarum]|uniref:Polyadenylate-binding protein n=1 Tax=Musa troglodytarum TaxID=320322 RepID=A0A9E7HQD2_9LILI|nr:Polyadenylate-binding protein [Musa troglodytarum]
MAQALMQQQAPNGTLATAEAAWPAPGKPVPVHVAVRGGPAGERDRNAGVRSVQSNRPGGDRPDMKGKMVRGKPLYVAPAQRKEDRRASLQARFSQVRPVAMGPGPSVGPRVPMYPPGAPGLGQQIFYGQPPPTLFPPQMVPKFRAHSYPPGGNVPDVQTPGAVGGMLNPNEMGGLPMQDVTMPQPIPIAALPSALANAPPEQQRLQLEPIDAAKVSGMLLEMDQTEVLHLLESPDALRAKVAEAMEVLRSVAQQQQANAPAD